MKKMILAFGFALLSVTGMTKLQAAHEYNSRADYLIIDDIILFAVPDHYMDAIYVEVSLESNGSVIGVQYTTPGRAVQFTVPDNATVLRVKHKYVMAAGEGLIIEDISTN